MKNNILKLVVVFFIFFEPKFGVAIDINASINTYVNIKPQFPTPTDWAISWSFTNT